jgi:hypothetical protein
MLDVKFVNPYDGIVFRGEENSGKSKVETAGYIPAQVQIERLILAGKRLSDFRREQYDFGADEQVPDDFVDPTRSPGYDLADAARDARIAVGRLRESVLEKEKAEASVKGSKAPEASPGKGSEAGEAKE